ncbi:MAG: hypothetical protein Q7R80_02785, partial [bacterium]|nr:hypothetical protein [bacterium]
GEAARDALRALNRMGEHQPYAQLHSWGPRPGKRDERGEVTIVNGLHQFEGWRIVGCMVEHPDTDRETWVFSLGTFRPPTRAGVVLIGAIEDRLVFPPERADYAKHRHPLLGVEFLGPVPNLDLTAPEGQDPPYREDEDKNSQAAQPQVIRRRTAGNRASGRRPRP